MTIIDLNRWEKMQEIKSGFTGRVALCEFIL